MIRNHDCTKCFLNSGAQSVCLLNEPDKKASPKIFAVKAYPSIEEDKTGKIFDSRDDYLINKLLFDIIGVSKKDVHFTYLIKCAPKTDEFNIAESYKECQAYFEQEIEALKPKIILGFGQDVHDLLKIKGGYKSNRGKLFDVTFGSHDLKFLPTYSAIEVIRNKNLLNPFGKDCDIACTIGNDYTKTDVATNWKLVKNPQELKQVLKDCEKVGTAAFDFETTGLEIFNGDYATGLAISYQYGYGFFIPLNHYQFPEYKYDADYMRRILQDNFFMNRKIRKIAHNTKFDMHVARNEGLWPIIGRLEDTMLMAHLLDENNSCGLKELTARYMPKRGNYDSELRKYKWDRVPVEVLGAYACADTDNTLRLFYQFEMMLMEEPKLYRYYRNLSLLVMKALQEIEYKGIKVNRQALEDCIKITEAYLVDQEKQLRNHPVVKAFESRKRKELVEAKIKELDDKINANVNSGKNRSASIDNYKSQKRQLQTGLVNLYEGINFKSPDQLKELFFSEKGFEFEAPVDYNGRKQYNTRKETLAQIKDKTGFIDGLTAYRTMSKTLATYLLSIHEKLDENDRIHAEFLQIGTVTGRLSCKNPNLQNLTKEGRIKNEKAKQVTSFVKKIFEPSSGNIFYHIDYSQAELRFIAEFAEEKTMIEAYKKDQDLHKLTASRLMGLNLDEFDQLPREDQKFARSGAKPANFGLIYLMSVEGYMEYSKNNYGVEKSLSQAKQEHINFFRMYPQIEVYHRTYIEKAKRFGRVWTFLGRCRRILDINNNNNWKRNLAERIAVNAPIQGSCGELTEFAIGLLHLRGVRGMVNQIHDAIEFDINEAEYKEWAPVIKETCENLPIKKFFGRKLEHVKMKIDSETSRTNMHELQEI